jgi:neutral amino acid transport system permease protein
MVDQLGNALVLGAVISITATGLSLIYGVTHVLNFAHGELVTLGAVVTLLCATTSSALPLHLGLPVGAAAVIALAWGALAGGVLDRTLFAPLARRGIGTVSLFVVTFGLSLILRHLILIVVGPETYQLPLAAQQTTSIAGVDLTPREALVIALSALTMSLVGVFLVRSRLGTAMRAMADTGELAEASGIDTRRVTTVTWMVGGALAALGGIFQAMTLQVSWDMGIETFLLMITAVVIGGVGSAFGAMAGGFAIGFLAEMSVGLGAFGGSATSKVPIALVVMVGVLLLRPQGLLGRAVRIS